MPLTDQQRIARNMANPRIMQLGRALAKLGSLTRFMNTGAHPDDEISGMLAALAFRDGLDVSIACANRGEGGQNDIGTEMTEDLGALRTAEMERAADRDIACFDFGRSKIGTGAADYKKHWGFTGIPLEYQFYLLGDADMPDVNPNNPKYARFVKIWQKLPLGVTKLVGPALARQLG